MRRSVLKVGMICTALAFVAAMFMYSDPDVAVRRAIAKADSNGVRKYLENGGDPNKQFNIPFAGPKSRQSLLHYAVDHSNPEACRILVKYGANPSQGDYSGRTPIMNAINNKLSPIAEREIFEYLLPLTDLSVIDQHGCSLLHYIAQFGDHEQYETVLKRAPWLAAQKDRADRRPSDIVQGNRRHKR